MLKLPIHFAVLLLGVGVFSTTHNELSEKEAIRTEIIRNVGRFFDRNQLEDVCQVPITPEQRTSASEKVQTFRKCVTATIDAFFERIEDDATRADFEDLSRSGRNFLPIICDLFGVGFKCAQDFEPVIDLCMPPVGIQAKRNIFVLAPIIFDTLCLRNGTVLSDLVEEYGAVRCAFIAYDWVMSNGVTELFLSSSSDLFGSEIECREFKRLQAGAISEIQNCSNNVFELSREFIGRFCRHTNCQQFVSDLECFM